jgi:uncharacterized membrane protein YdjX (TVP38/TMEM64 family)
MGRMTDETKTTPKPPISTADKLKFAGLVVFILLIIAVGVLLVPYFNYFTTEEGRLELIHMIQDAGAWGVLICLGLQFLQVVVAFIPGEVVQLVIGAIYGPFFGTLLTAIGALVSSMFVFVVVRRLGAPFVHSMIGKNHADKLRFFQESKRLDTIVFVLFLIPGLPKDVFTYLVPLTKMRAANFFILSTLGRIPGIAASAYIGNAAAQGDYVGATIVGVIAGGLGLLGIVFNQKIMTLVDRITQHFARPKEP